MKKPPRPLRKEGSPYWMKICNTLLTYPPLSEWDSPLFGGAGGGWRSGGRLPFVTALHVTRYIFAYGVFVGRQGGYSLLLYIIYILYIIIILFIF